MNDRTVELAHEAVLQLRTDNRFRAVMNLIQRYREETKDALCDVAPEKVALLQGKARAYKTILDLEDRAKNAIERRTQASKRA